jgi:aspartyl/glutamyl-tRNA(Asn/Gln) amidotransferase C subunit
MIEITEKLDKAAQVIKVAVSAEERGQLADELSCFMNWLEPMLAVDSSGSEQVLNSHGAVNVMRSDDAQLVEKADLQKAAPDFEDGFYQVPPIIE